jgi:hypothetical protein
MARLSSADLADVAAQFMRDCSADRDPLEILKQHVHAAVDAADAWADANAASFNSALPVQARSGLTSSQKARLLNAVTSKRWIKEAGG